MQTSVENCPNHLENYSGKQKWGARDEVPSWEFTCTRCGHTWTAEAPALELEMRMEVQAEVRLDLIGYFNGLHETARKAYGEVSLEEVGFDDAEWKRPMAFLYPDDIDLYSILPCQVATLPGRPQIIRESIEVDDASQRVRSRNGRYVYGDGMEWSEEDFATLRAAVPWLDAWHTSQEGYDASDPADVARRPGPNDDPLPLEGSDA